MRRAAIMRLRAQADRDLVLAWDVEYVRVKTQNDKRMPSVRQLLLRGQAEKPSRSQQAAVYQEIAARFKLPMRVNHG